MWIIFIHLSVLWIFGSVPLSATSQYLFHLGLLVGDKTRETPSEPTPLMRS